MTHMTGMAVKTPFYWTWVRLPRLLHRAACPPAHAHTAAAQLGLTLVVFTVALPLCIWDLSRHHHERAYIGAPHAGATALVCAP